MPVIFSTPTSHRVFMFDKDAAFMLKAMKTSGSIPGALFSDDVKDALTALNDRINLDSDAENLENEESNNQDDDNYVSINKKALPLIEIMQRAIEQNEKLMWEKG